MIYNFDFLQSIIGRRRKPRFYRRVSWGLFPDYLIEKPCFSENLSTFVYQIFVNDYEKKSLDGGTCLPVRTDGL